MKAKATTLHNPGVSLYFYMQKSYDMKEYGG